MQVAGPGLSAGDDLYILRRLNQCESAGDGLALNRLALARNGGGLQVYFSTYFCVNNVRDAPTDACRLHKPVDRRTGQKHYASSSNIGVNAAGVTGVRAPDI